MFLRLTVSTDNIIRATIILPEIGECFIDNKISGDVLEIFSQLLKKRDSSLSDIKGIAVVKGAGSFTAVRRVAVMANVLAFALRVPVVAVLDESIETITKAFNHRGAGRYILPFYSSEPRIGPPTI